MNLRKLFQRKPDTSQAARTMALQGVDRRKAVVRARVDQMRADKGLEPAQWPK